MKAFSWKTFLLLIVISSSMACRLVTEGISAVQAPEVESKPDAQVEEAVQVQPEALVQVTAEPTDTPDEPIATATSDQSGSEDDNSAILPEMPNISVDDVCSILPKEIFSPMIGREMVGSPEPFEDDFLGKGCTYDFGEENGAANFLYISIAPIESFKAGDEMGSNVTEIPYLPEDAFSVDAADAQQLWAKIDAERALVIGIGDQPNQELAVQLAFLLLPLIQSMP